MAGAVRQCNAMQCGVRSHLLDVVRLIPGVGTDVEEATNRPRCLEVRLFLHAQGHLKVKDLHCIECLYVHPVERPIHGNHENVVVRVLDVQSHGSQALCVQEGFNGTDVAGAIHGKGPNEHLLTARVYHAVGIAGLRRFHSRTSPEEMGFANCIVSIGTPALSLDLHNTQR